MNKLKLDLDGLEVETFEAAVAEDARGTVDAHESGGGIGGGGTCYYHCTFRGFTCDFGSCGCPLTSDCPELTVGC